MKTIYTILLYLVCILPAWCQNNVGKADDMSRLVLTPCVVSNSSIPSYANAVVKNKLNQIVTKNGVGGNSLNQRFVITINLVEITKEFTATAPPMIALALSPTIYVGDGETGELYSSCQIKEVKGVGENETKAYLDAIKRINVNNSDVATCIEEGKVRIVEYYNSQIDFIIAESESLLNSERYDESMALLASVPTVCKDAYEKAMLKIADVYQKKIDNEGAALYNEAYALWNSSKSKDTALQVVELIAQINPLSKSAKQGRTIVASIEAHWAEIEARRRELEVRAWAFKMQQYNDARADKQAEFEFKVQQHNDNMADRAQTREMDHEYRMKKATFDYDVEVKRAENGTEAALMALQEVKGVMNTISTGKSNDSKLNKVIEQKVAAWLK